MAIRSSTVIPTVGPTVRRPCADDPATVDAPSSRPSGRRTLLSVLGQSGDAIQAITAPSLSAVSMTAQRIVLHDALLI
jgi:hypothetical protein